MSSYRFVLPTTRLLAIAMCVLLASAPAVAVGKEKVLYGFQGIPDGSQPIGSLVFGKDGSLYGATFSGGSFSCQYQGDCGTVYQLKPPVKDGDPWTETVLYVFKGTNQNDGETGGGGLVFDAVGNLYGATGFGGSGNCMLFGGRVGCGTVYELSPPTVPGGEWTETVLYSFQGGNDGQLPGGELVFDKLGNLYGATEYGGGFGSCNAPSFEHCGAVFELRPPKVRGGKWTEQVLYGFKSGKDGANPNGGLIFSMKGAIYGTAFAGGDQVCTGPGSVGCGTLYQLTPPLTKGGRWTEKTLYRFVVGFPDGGAGPNGSLVLDSKGRLYGTADGGGPGDGVAFEVSRYSGQWEETVVHTFQLVDGRAPSGGLIFDSFGSLYGVTSEGGSNDGGALFSLKVRRGDGGKWRLNLLHSFSGRPPDGYDPVAHLIFDGVGNLYGVTQEGGNGCHGGCGTVYEFTPKR